VNRATVLAGLCFLVSALVGCSADLYSASSFYFRTDVVSESGQYRLDATSLLYRSAGGERVVRPCTGEVRGLRSVADRERTIVVVACGSRLQLSLGFVVDGVVIDEGDSCIFIHGRLAPAADRPWRASGAFQSVFTPFDRNGSCS
jgi:hypothetical protein